MQESQEIFRILLPIVASHLVILVVIILVIKRLLLGDTVRAVERIGQAEAEIRKREEAMKSEMERHEQDVAARHRESEEDLVRRREDSDREISSIKDGVLNEARMEAAAILDKARNTERQLREQVTIELGDKAVDLAGSVFQLVFSDRVGEALNEQFTDELLDALQATDATGITVDEGNAEFSASHPLSPERKQRLQAILAEKFGSTIAINETINPDLLAGLVIKIGSLEIDGSLLSRYREAVTELKKESI